MDRFCFCCTASPDVNPPEIVVETGVSHGPYELQDSDVVFYKYEHPTDFWVRRCAAEWYQTDLTVEDISRGALQRFRIDNPGLRVSCNRVWGPHYECPYCHAVWHSR